MNESLTKSGIAYDLNLSPYKFKISYGDEYVEYTFSSELYRDKFRDKIQDHRNKINMSLSKRFGYEITNNILSDIKLYTATEKRGFLLETGKERFECLSTIRLDGHHLMKKN